MTSTSPTSLVRSSASLHRRSSSARVLVRRARDARFGRPLGVAIIAVMAAVAAWFRFTPTDRDILWAEDGRNFLQNAIDAGPFDSILRPYAGYLHTIPRIIAGITVQFAPVSKYAVWMTAGSCIAAGVMAAIVFVCSAEVVRWMPARILLASLTVLLPLAPREVLGNTANLHSLVLWTLFWVVLYRPRSRAGSVGLAVFALLGALTEIQAVALLPLLFLVGRRDRARWFVRGAFLVGIVAQLFVTLFWPRGHNSNPLIGLGSLLYGYLFNSVVPVWVPQQLVGAFAASAGILGCALLAAPFAAAFVVILRWGTDRARLVAVALVVLSVLVYVVSVEDSPRPSYDYASLSASALTSSSPIRYGVVPGILLCALMVIAVSVVWERARAGLFARPNAGRVAAIAAVAVLSAALVVQFVPPTRRSNGPQWQPEVASASELCVTLPDSVRVPLRETIGWHVDVPCGMLEQP